jgi:hypothetical protein
VQHHPIRGYLLANGIEANGRVLALLYTGEPGTPDREPVFVDETRLEASVNAQLIREGLAYAELYSTMPLNLIHRMRQLVTNARDAKAGFWPTEDVTTTAGVTFTNLADLSTAVMFPKLYRRLVKYFKEGHTDLAAFDTWVRADPNRDDQLLLPTGELGNLHDLYTVDPGGITLAELPENVTFTS